MNQAGVKPEDRAVVGAALKREEETGHPAAAIALPEGMLGEGSPARVVTGKTSDLLGAASAALMNTIKVLAGLPDDELLISEESIVPIQTLKTAYLGGHNPRLHTDEVLIALAISAATNPVAELAMQQISNLMNSDAHSTTMMSSVDINMFHKLGINLTCEPVYETKKLYHR